MHKKLVATVAVATFAGLGAGFAIGTPSLVGAQTAGSDTTIAADGTKPARPNYLSDALKKLVADGTINQTQADAVAKAIKDARPANAGKGGPGKHGGRPGGPMGGMGSMITGGMNLIDAAAKALGITTEELITQVKGGTTVAKIAESKGVALNTVVEAVVKAMSTKIDDAVTAGKLTQAEADAKKASLTKIVTDFANGAIPSGPMGAGGPGGRGPGGRGKGPFGGQAKPNVPTTTTTVAAGS